MRNWEIEFVLIWIFCQNDNTTSPLVLLHFIITSQVLLPADKWRSTDQCFDSLQYWPKWIHGKMWHGNPKNVRKSDVKFRQFECAYCCDVLVFTSFIRSNFEAMVWMAYDTSRFIIYNSFSFCDFYLRFKFNFICESGSS